MHTNRFLFEHRRRFPAKPVMSLAFTAAILLLSFLELDSAAENTASTQKQTLEDAVYQSIIQCYVMEGRYPQDLAYLEEHYPLLYDRERFFIDYRPIGENLMPEVTVITRSP